MDVFIAAFNDYFLCNTLLHHIRIYIFHLTSSNFYKIFMCFVFILPKIIHKFDTKNIIKICKKINGIMLYI